LGIISNFDSRIYQVLAELGLEYFFRSITISSQTGAAKPDAEIFQIALQKHDCSPAQAWHIGDSKKEDYQGAKALGIEAFLIKRSIGPAE
jgi:putative hydrolase of the HAD superfamily